MEDSEYIKMEILGMLETSSLTFFNDYVMKALDAKSKYESYKQNEKARKSINENIDTDDLSGIVTAGIVKAFMGAELSEKDKIEFEKIARKASAIIKLVISDNEIIEKIEEKVDSLEDDAESRAEMVYAISSLVNTSVKIRREEKDSKEDSWSNIRQSISSRIEDFDSIEFKMMIDSTMSFQTLRMTEYNEVTARKIKEMPDSIFASFWLNTMDGFIPQNSEASRAIEERKKEAGIFTTLVRRYDEETINGKSFKLENVEQAESQNSVEAILSLLRKPLTTEENKILQKKLETLNSYQILQILMVAVKGRVSAINNDISIIKRSLRNLSNDECYAFAVKYENRLYTGNEVVNAVYDELVRRKLINKYTVNDEEPKYEGELKVKPEDIAFLDYLELVACPIDEMVNCWPRIRLSDISIESLVEETYSEQIEEWYESSRESLETFCGLAEYIEAMEKGGNYNAIKEIQKTNRLFSEGMLAADKNGIAEIILRYFGNRIISIDDKKELGLIAFCYNFKNTKAPLNYPLDRVTADKVIVRMKAPLTGGENPGTASAGEGR